MTTPPLNPLFLSEGAGLGYHVIISGGEFVAYDQVEMMVTG